MAERTVSVGVPANFYHEVELRRNLGDFLTEDMFMKDVDELLKALNGVGLVQIGDQIQVVFYPDEKLPDNSRGRHVKVTHIIRDHQGENIIDRRSVSVFIDSGYKNQN